MELGPISDIHEQAISPAKIKAIQEKNLALQVNALIPRINKLLVEKVNVDNDISIYLSELDEGSIHLLVLQEIIKIYERKDWKVALFSDNKEGEDYLYFSLKPDQEKTKPEQKSKPAKSFARKNALLEAMSGRH